MSGHRDRRAEHDRSHTGESPRARMLALRTTPPCSCCRLRAGNRCYVRTNTTAEYSVLFTWRVPLQMPPDCLLDTAVVECDTPSTLSAGNPRAVAGPPSRASGATAHGPRSPRPLAWVNGGTSAGRFRPGSCHLIRCRGRHVGRVRSARVRAVAERGRPPRWLAPIRGAARRDQAARGLLRSGAQRREAAGEHQPSEVGDAVGVDGAALAEADNGGTSRLRR
jgi:hypothetical protein